MSNINIRPITADDREQVTQFIVAHWGTTTMVAHGVVYETQNFPGFIAEVDDALAGLVTYHIEGASCEIVIITSTRSGGGIGTRLIDAVTAMARLANLTRIWLITTNDNLNALRFYQKRGFELVAVHRNAVAQARRIKPEIPLLGDYDIPIRDEIELELRLNNVI